jgi:hypothetical protein
MCPNPITFAVERCTRTLLSVGYIDLCVVSDDANNTFCMALNDGSISEYRVNGSDRVLI